MSRFTPVSESTRKLLGELARRAYGITSPFAASGTFSTQAPVTLRFANGEGVSTDLEEHVFARAVEAHCHPARFGEGRATRYSRAVRDARQLNAAGGTFTVEGFDPAASGVLEKVRAELCPRDPSPLTAELYSVNVYQTGGHFVPHKDTPRGDDMLGTLVLCLTDRFWGGELVLQHGGAQETFKLRSDTYRYGPRDSFEWVAFFSDVDHEVKEVRSGTRVTVTWTLRRGHDAVRPKARRDSLTERFAEGLQGALADREFFAKGATLGFSCFHLYAEAPGFVRAVPPLTRASVLRLKGRDQHIAAAALDRGLSARFVPYLIEDQVDERWELTRFPTRAERAVFRRHRIDNTVLHKELPIAADPDEDRVTWVLLPSRAYERRGAAPREEPVVEFVGDVEYSSTGYFGNEGGPAEFYMHGALLVEIPSWSARQKLVRAHAKALATETATTTVKRATARAPASVPTKREPTSARPAGELTAAQLRELGYTPARVKKLLAEGELERVGFGWYRFVDA